MDKNKLIFPVVILLGSIILGGFYYVTEVNKQKSIERQQGIKLEDEKRIENERTLRDAADTRKKRLCADESIEDAKHYYKDNCTYDCKEGIYNVVTYNNYYSTCLQRAGL